MRGDGDCFEMALVTALRLELEGVTDVEVVHGIPLGQGPIAGQRFSHGWVELDNGVVLDFSNGKHTIMSRVEYYALGHIEVTRRYSLAEAKRQALTTGHYGPWDKSLQLEG